MNRLTASGASQIPATTSKKSILNVIDCMWIKNCRIGWPYATWFRGGHNYSTEWLWASSIQDKATALMTNRQKFILRKFESGLGKVNSSKIL